MQIALPILLGWLPSTVIDWRKKTAGAAACRCLFHFGWCGYVRIKYRFGSCARQFLNVQNVSGQTTDVWFLLGLLGNVVDASKGRFFTFIWHTVIIPASCTSGCSQHVVIFSIHLYTNLGFRCQHPSLLWYRLAPSKALQVGLAVERPVMQDVVTTEASHVGTSMLLDSYGSSMGGLWNSGVPNRFHQHYIVRVEGGFSLIVLSVWGALWLLD